MISYNNNSSRLTETSFSNNNLRNSYISPQAEYLTALRDEALFSNWGIPVSISVPCHSDGVVNENNVDEYSNFVDERWLTTTETVVPLFKEYRQNVSEEGMSADGTDSVYPLQMYIPSKLHLPKNSKIVLTEYNSRDEQIAREWTVLSTEMKQLSDSKTYARIANCVPTRKILFNTGETYEVNYGFYVNPLEVSLVDTLSCQGVLWFDRQAIATDKIFTVFVSDLQENPTSGGDTQEQLRLPLFLDTRTINIAFSGMGFAVGEEFNVLDDNGDTVEVVQYPSEELTTLKMIIDEVGDLGQILKYHYNVSGIYSAGSILDALTVISLRPNNTEFFAVARINFVTCLWEGEIYSETNIEDGISDPKYVLVNNKRIVFAAKPIAASVLTN